MGFEDYFDSPEAKIGIQEQLFQEGKGFEAMIYSWENDAPWGDDDTLRAERANPAESPDILRARYGEVF